jgi:alginate O-acetyltransferase complex protein AlgI
VFLATWFLHGYQMFWLKGSWGFSVPDALFWGVLGMLVLVNVQLDARETPRKPGRPGGLALAVRAGKTAATFATIALLWSLWSSPSLSAWIAMFRRAFAG